MSETNKTVFLGCIETTILLTTNKDFYQCKRGLETCNEIAKHRKQ